MPAVSPGSPATQHFHEEPRQPKPDRHEQEGEGVEDWARSKPPSRQAGERRLGHDRGDEPADRDRAPLHPTIVPAHGPGAADTPSYDPSGRAGALKEARDSRTDPPHQGRR